MDYFQEYQNIKSNLVINTCGGKDDVHISFIIPTFSRVNVLKNALVSIQNLRKLNESSYEIIIMDNSGDMSENNATKDFLLTQKISNLKYYINDANIGMVGNWNRGIELANGEYVSFVHDDDVLSSNYLVEMNRYLEQIKNTGTIGFIKVKHKSFKDENCMPALYNSDKKIRKVSALETILLGRGATAISSCGIIFSRKALLNVGGFNPSLFPSADQEIGVRLLKNNYAGYMTPSELAYYRIGLNESMKVETIKGFVIKDTQIRQEVYSLKWYGKIFSSALESFFYSTRIDFWISYAKEEFNIEISVTDLDFKNEYKPAKWKKMLLNFSRKVYRTI